MYGGSVSFDIDLSKVGCSCQLAFDLLNIPGYDINNMPDPGNSGDYDCDAQNKNGVLCQSINLITANKYNLFVALH